MIDLLNHPLAGVIIGALIGALFSFLGQYFAFRQNKRRDVAMFKDKLLQERLTPVYEFRELILVFTGFSRQQAIWQEFHFANSPEEVKKRIAQQEMNQLDEYREGYARLSQQAKAAILSLDSEDLQSAYNEVMQHAGDMSHAYGDKGKVDYEIMLQKSEILTNSLAKLTDKLDEFRRNNYSSNY